MKVLFRLSLLLNARASEYAIEAFAGSFYSKTGLSNSTL